ncbi:MAG: hypothetical protein ACRDPC_10655 [Solirubrobacteraceae bacterium]
MSSSGAEETRTHAALRERDRELALVADVLDAADRGCGALVVVDGAQSLFPTVRTIEMHLTHAYRKLGVTSRRELGRALGA